MKSSRITLVPWGNLDPGFRPDGLHPGYTCRVFEQARRRAALQVHLLRCWSGPLTAIRFYRRLPASVGILSVRVSSFR